MVSNIKILFRTIIRWYNLKYNLKIKLWLWLSIFYLWPHFRMTSFNFIAFQRKSFQQIIFAWIIWKRIIVRRTIYKIKNVCTRMYQYYPFSNIINLTPIMSAMCWGRKGESVLEITSQFTTFYGFFQHRRNSYTSLRNHDSVQIERKNKWLVDSVS